jgi:hypothetical protein
MAASFIGGGNREKDNDLSQVTDKLYHIYEISGVHIDGN